MVCTAVDCAPTGIRIRRSAEVCDLPKDTTAHRAKTLIRATAVWRQVMGPRIPSDSWGRGEGQFVARKGPLKGHYIRCNRCNTRH